MSGNEILERMSIDGLNSQFRLQLNRDIRDLCTSLVRLAALKMVSGWVTIG